MLLSLDPGKTTGYAVIIPEKLKILRAGELTVEQIVYMVAQQDRPPLMFADVSEVVIEVTPPQGTSKLARILTIVNDGLSQLFRVPMTRLMPSEWKQSRYRGLKTKELPWWDSPRRYSRHELDAVTMGLYFLDKHRGRSFLDAEGRVTGRDEPVPAPAGDGDSDSVLGSLPPTSGGLSSPGWNPVSDGFVM